MKATILALVTVVALLISTSAADAQYRPATGYVVQPSSGYVLPRNIIVYPQTYNAYYYGSINRGIYYAPANTPIIYPASFNYPSYSYPTFNYPSTYYGSFRGNYANPTWGGYYNNRNWRRW